MAKEKKGLSKTFWLLFIIIFLLLLGVVVFAFVMDSKKEPDVIVKTKDGGKIKLNYSSLKNVFTLTDIKPITDDIGINLSDNEILKNDIPLKRKAGKGEEEGKVEKEDSGAYNGLLKPSKFIPLKKDSVSGTKKGNMIIAKETVKKSGKSNYRLRIWLSSSSLMVMGDYSVEINISAVAK